MEKSLGTVKWFDNVKGFGFLSTDKGEDIFVHFSSIVEDGFKTLKEGEEVSFSVESTDRGLQAKDVFKI